MIGETLMAPRPGPGVCVDCFTFVGGGLARCRVCERMERHLAAAVPIVYSVAGGTLHRDIRAYKRDADPSVNDAVNRLAGLLARFLPEHERCLAARCGIERFDLVTTVPSQWAAVAAPHPLERIAGVITPATRARYMPVLRRTDTPLPGRRFDARRFAAVAALDGAQVLLIDDLWTSGASAQSAAAALRDAGATTVAAVVIARHLNGGWSRNEALLPELAAPLNFGRCAHCAPESLVTGRDAAVNHAA